jgi:hypothetical protein
MEDHCRSLKGINGKSRLKASLCRSEDGNDGIGIGLRTQSGLATVYSNLDLCFNLYLH